MDMPTVRGGARCTVSTPVVVLMAVTTATFSMFRIQALIVKGPDSGL